MIKLTDIVSPQYIRKNNMTDHNIEVKNAGFTAEVKGKEIKASIDEAAKYDKHEHIDATKHAPAHKPA